MKLYLRARAHLIAIMSIIMILLPGPVYFYESNMKIGFLERRESHMFNEVRLSYRPCGRAL